MAPLRETFEALLWDERAHDGWPGSKRKGYGQLWVDGKMRAVHVIACERAHGPRPTPQHQVRHSCRNPACFWPPHLSWGTPKENAGEDRRRDGTIPKGENHGRARLTQRQVDAIRERYARGGISQRGLAREYEVAPMTINYIVNGTRWT